MSKFFSRRSIVLGVLAGALWLIAVTSLLAG